MTAYCGVADITALTGIQYGPTSQPTQAIVTGWCDTFSGELDNALRVVGVASPVDAAASPVSYALCRQYVAFKVAGIADSSAYLGNEAIRARAEAYLKLYEALLRDLKNGVVLRFADALPTLQAPTDRYTGWQSGNLLPDPDEAAGPGNPPPRPFTSSMVF